MHTLTDLTQTKRDEQVLDEAVRRLAVVARVKSLTDANAEVARRWPESATIRAARAALQTKATAGTPSLTGSPAGWGGELAQQTQLSAALTQYARQLGIVGRLGLTSAPFATSVPRIVDDSVAVFRGPGEPKLAIDGAFDQTSLRPIVIALMIAFSSELARLTDDVSTKLLRTLLGRAVARGIDAVFFSTTAASESTPPGVLFGLTPIASVNDPVVDLQALVTAFVAAGGSASDAVLVMSSANAIGAMLSGNAAFRALGRDGGDAAGIPAVCGVGAGDNIVLLDRSKVLLADDGIARIDSATHATLDLGNGDPFALWQRNCVGLRVEQAVNWSAAPGGVAYVSGVDYLSAAGSPS